MKNLLLAFASILLAALLSFAQAPEKSGMIKTANGILVVWNEPGNCYTVEIKGKRISPVNGSKNLYFEVDGRFLQINTPPISDFEKGTPFHPEFPETILRDHRTWELDYISKMVGRQLFPSTEWIKLDNGGTSLFWTYNVPNFSSDANQARKQFYITTVKGDHIFLVNSAQVGEDDEKAIRKFLFDTINTLKPSDKPLSLEKASEMVKGN
jgi:hypothetical protein